MDINNETPDVQEDVKAEEQAPIVSESTTDAPVVSSPAEADAPAVEPDANPMPVERQEIAHEQQAVVNPNAALQPGRPFVATDDLLGEIDTLIHNADQKGDQGLSAELHSVKLRIGDLINHINTISTEYSASIYKKIIDFFKKS